MIAEKDCSNRQAHRLPEGGYVNHAAWAEEMRETHKQQKCEGCGYWIIWTARTDPYPKTEGESR